MDEVVLCLIEGLLIFEGEYEDDAVECLVEILGEEWEGGDVWCGVCVTVFVLEDEFVFGLIECEDDCLWSFEDEVMVVDEFVFGEAGDEVGFAYALAALILLKGTTIM